MLRRIKEKLQGRSLSEILRWCDMRFGLGKLEGAMCVNWFNPFYTIYLNFRSFSIKQAFYLPVFVYGRPKMMCLSGTMRIEGEIKPGMVTLNNIVQGAPTNMSVPTEICNKGEIIFRGPGLIGTGNKIFVEWGCTLELGEHFKISDMCNVGCFSGIKVGRRCRLAHRCQLLDSNYHFVANFGKRIVPDYKKPIMIGDDVWVCNSTTITAGTIIPDSVIVASNSLVNRDFSSLEKFSMIGGAPAKFILSGIKRVESNSKFAELVDFYKSNSQETYLIAEEDDITEY